jgi:hypothetical protein
MQNGMYVVEKKHSHASKDRRFNEQSQSFSQTF